jgi:hypothetical protein
VILRSFNAPLDDFLMAKKTFRVPCAFSVPAYFYKNIEADTPEEAIQIAQKMCEEGTMWGEDWNYVCELGDGYRVSDEDPESTVEVESSPA